MQASLSHISKYYIRLQQLKEARRTVPGPEFTDVEKSLIKEFLDGDIADLTDQIKYLLGPYVKNKAPTVKEKDDIYLSVSGNDRS